MESFVYGNPYYSVRMCKGCYFVLPTDSVITVIARIDNHDEADNNGDLVHINNEEDDRDNAQSDNDVDLDNNNNNDNDDSCDRNANNDNDMEDMAD
eukprot:2817284-Ditylum_brightwellii.AAC.1